jgi:hypothetical protein
MQLEGLGRAITAPFSTPGATATLHERGLLLAGDAGTVTARFGFARSDGPAVATTGAVRAVVGDPIRFHIGGWRPSALESGLRWALSGRLGLRESGAGGNIVPVVPGAVELDDGGHAAMRCRAHVGDGRLYDVLARGDGGWTVVARSAVYGRAGVAPPYGRRRTPSAIRLIGLGDLIGG